MLPSLTLTSFGGILAGGNITPRKKALKIAKNDNT